jgi:hypothetical protein
MIPYKLYVDGEPLGQPLPENEIDRIIWRTQPSISNELEKRPYVPDLKLVVGEVR